LRTNVVVGLGNPGSSYGRSRHNVGFRVVDTLAERHGLRFSKREHKSQVAEGRIGGVGALLMKPQTYMNLSGEAVGRARRALGLDPQQFIVVYDDLDLAVGRVRVRAGGSAGGHHGVESIIEALGSKEFPRVRIGIGRPASKSGNVDYLLDAITTEEAETLAEAVARGADAVEAMLAEGVPAAMNQFNGHPRGDRRSQTIDRR
jgi:peptidyl-tRNA hydrolase, PTH1 family